MCRGLVTNLSVYVDYYFSQSDSLLTEAENAFHASNMQFVTHNPVEGERRRSILPYQTNYIEWPDTCPSIADCTPARVNASTAALQYTNLLNTCIEASIVSVVGAACLAAGVNSIVGSYLTDSTGIPDSEISFLQGNGVGAPPPFSSCAMALSGGVGINGIAGCLAYVIQVENNLLYLVQNLQNQLIAQNNLVSQVIQQLQVFQGQALTIQSELTQQTQDLSAQNIVSQQAMYAQGLQNDLSGITDQALSDSETTQQQNNANLQALTQLSMVQAQNSNNRIEQQLNQINTFLNAEIDASIALVYKNLEAVLLTYQTEMLQNLNQLALQETSTTLQVQSNLNQINNVVNYLQFFIAQMGVIFADNARVMQDVVSELTGPGDLVLDMQNAYSLMALHGEDPFLISVGSPPLNLSVPTVLMVRNFSIALDQLCNDVTETCRSCTTPYQSGNTEWLTDVLTLIAESRILTWYVPNALDVNYPQYGDEVYINVLVGGTYYYLTNGGCTCTSGCPGLPTVPLCFRSSGTALPFRIQNYQTYLLHNANETIPVTGNAPANVFPDDQIYLRGTGSFEGYTVTPNFGASTGSTGLCFTPGLDTISESNTLLIALQANATLQALFSPLNLNTSVFFQTYLSADLMQGAGDCIVSNSSYNNTNSLNFNVVPTALSTHLNDTGIPLKRSARRDVPRGPDVKWPMEKPGTRLPEEDESRKRDILVYDKTAAPLCTQAALPGYFASQPNAPTVAQITSCTNIDPSCGLVVINQPSTAVFTRSSSYAAPTDVSYDFPSSQCIGYIPTSSATPAGGTPCMYTSVCYASSATSCIYYIGDIPLVTWNAHYYSYPAPFVSIPTGYDLYISFTTNSASGTTTFTTILSTYMTPDTIVVFDATVANVADGLSGYGFEAAESSGNCVNNAYRTGSTWLQCAPILNLFLKPWPQGNNVPYAQLCMQTTASSSLRFNCQNSVVGPPSGDITLPTVSSNIYPHVNLVYGNTQSGYDGVFLILPSTSTVPIGTAASTYRATQAFSSTAATQSIDPSYAIQMDYPSFFMQQCYLACGSVATQASCQTTNSMTCSWSFLVENGGNSCENNCPYNSTGLCAWTLSGNVTTQPAYSCSASYLGSLYTAITGNSPPSAAALCGQTFGYDRQLNHTAGIFTAVDFNYYLNVTSSLVCVWDYNLGCTNYDAGFSNSVQQWIPCELRNIQIQALQTNGQSGSCYNQQNTPQFGSKFGNGGYSYAERCAAIQNPNTNTLTCVTYSFDDAPSNTATGTGSYVTTNHTYPPVNPNYYAPALSATSGVAAALATFPGICYAPGVSCYMEPGAQYGLNPVTTPVTCLNAPGLYTTMNWYYEQSFNRSSIPYPCTDYTNEENPCECTLKTMINGIPQCQAGGVGSGGAACFPPCANYNNDSLGCINEQYPSALNVFPTDFW